MIRHTLLALAVLTPAILLGTGGHATAGDITFENIPGMTPMSPFWDNTDVPPDMPSAPSSRLGTQLQVSDGVSFSSDAGYVALVNLGSGHATDGVAGIGGVTAANVLKYHSPVIITFTMPGDPTIPAVTNSVSIRGDNFPNTSGLGFATIEAFDVNGVLLKSVKDVPDAVGFTLSISVANIHSVRITQTLSDIAFDELHFNPLSRALNVAPIADAGPDQGVFIGNPVSLNGSLSRDADVDPLTFSWTLARPDGSTAVLTGDTTPFPTFTADVPGTYTATLTVTDSFGATASDSVDVSAITSSQSVEALILRALNLIGAMPPEQVTTRGNQNALQNFLTQTLEALHRGDVEHARDKLATSLARTDGCALRERADDGEGDQRDWVIDCAAQAAVYGLLTNALGALAP